MNSHITALLLSLAELESGNNDHAVGAAGERSRYQIKESAWNVMTSAPFTIYAQKPKYAIIVATELVKRDISNFTNLFHRVPTAQESYAMFNQGWTGFERHHFAIDELSPALRDRCERFANLVEEFEKVK